LSSLVIGLPLLFMSGILFPIEFMPPPVALVSFASPLTQAVLSMQGAMLYHSLQAALSTVLILYDIVLIFLIGLSLRKK
ncbi:MAG: hypothetical protein KGH63_03905, partial [Candidatus Micrarchaeota archaeon]|nr:hypothetical protein [Candidatus Micrarchaeota archaeon]